MSVAGAEETQTQLALRTPMALTPEVFRGTF